MSDSEKVVPGPSCSFVFKKRTLKCRAGRKRPKSDSSSEGTLSEADDSMARPSRRKTKQNPNVHKSKGLEKLTKPTRSSSDEGSVDVMVSYKSKRSAMPEGPQDQGATAIVETETEKDRDAQAIFEKRQEINKNLEGKEDDKVYRGLNNYLQYFKPRDTAAGNASSGMVRQGPIRAPENIRTTVRWDYQPDLCKDYKETGFCGFGDSCKFLHDRSDYKPGWELEKEWAEGKYGVEDEEDKKYEIPSDEEDYPTLCGICRKEFEDPVVTKCKHYFCEKCALERYKKTMRCFECNAQVTTFNPARILIAKLKSIAEMKHQHPESDESS